MGDRKRQRDDSVHPHSSENIELSQEQNVSEGNDIISSLPGNVLHHILSFLSTKDAIRTSILSTKWEYLWTSISDIDLTDNTFPRTGKKEDRSLLDFVDRVFHCHDASDIKSLTVKSSELVNSSRVNSWISASMRHNIEELNLSLNWKARPVLPCHLFTCQSLVTLKLFMKWSLKVPSLTHFSNLKTLELSYVTFSDDNSTQHLFSSCPVLQELALVKCGWKNLKTIMICIPTLRRLTIENAAMWTPDFFSCVTKIYAANLIHLRCISSPVVDFRLYDLSLLVDASIGFHDNYSAVDVTPQVLGLLSGVVNVKRLLITIDILECLSLVENLLDRLPTFYNMIHLELNFEFYGLLFGVLMVLLEKTPKLEFLNFEKVRHRDNMEDYTLGRVPSCFTSSLKTVRIAYFTEDPDPEEMWFIRFLLKNATVLERLVLHCYSADQEKHSGRLNKLPRGSKSCVIELLPFRSPFLNGNPP
ncbi:F-box/LRR-repeat protein At4g14103-like isoform X2 [Rhododendron vialii]|uniref:F-box/LRR-repeat protein At4g14103-like isoform X2 n=1 Tax=Rhododendron vialii TaxID=182163 RepID=UPI00265FA44C|nr:F-box/LRR-repeat protein At4g14103-like isoform X2 [Rhododendron vialii]